MSGGLEEKSQVWELQVGRQEFLFTVAGGDVVLVSGQRRASGAKLERKAVPLKEDVGRAAPVGPLGRVFTGTAMDTGRRGSLG